MEIADKKIFTFKPKMMTNWKKETVQKVWEKATEVDCVDGKLWRKDIAGAWISRKHYANSYSEYGWEIDHIEPISGRGTQYSSMDVSNIQPLQWQNKAAKAEDYPRFSTAMTSEINVNVEKTQYWNYIVHTSSVKKRKKLEVAVPNLRQA